MQVAGIHNVLTKSLGTSNPHNVVKATFAALLSLSSPVLGLRVTQVDANDVPRSSSSRQVYNAIQQDYPLIDNSPIFLAVQTPVSTTSKAPLEQYVRQLQKLSHVAAIEGPSRLDARMWQINVVPATAPLSPASQSLARRFEEQPWQRSSLRVGDLGDGHRICGLLDDRLCRPAHQGCVDKHPDNHRDVWRDGARLSEWGA